MAEIQPPNTQALRPQHLTQVGHEGNPVEFFIDVDSTLDSPNPFQCDDDSCVDVGGPVLYPVPGTGGGGSGGGDTITLPLSGGSGTMNCISGETNVPLTVTGGTPPYSWTASAGVLGSSTTPDGNNTLNPAANTGGSVPNDRAGGVCVHFCSILGFPDCRGFVILCDGSVNGGDTCASSGIQTICSDAGWDCSCSVCAGCDGLSFTIQDTNACCNLPVIGDACSNPALALATRIDQRSGAQIADGCNPCFAQFVNPPTITVTDSTGQSVIFSVPVEHTP